MEAMVRSVKVFPDPAYLNELQDFSYLSIEYEQTLLEQSQIGAKRASLIGEQLLLFLCLLDELLHLPLKRVSGVKLVPHLELPWTKNLLEEEVVAVSLVEPCNRV